MSDKIFKTTDEQIDILNSRGIAIISQEDINYARQVLQKESYYNLINGYSNLFIDHLSDTGEPIYKTGTTLKEINALYQFDRVLRNTLLNYVLIVESHIKSLLAYYFPMRYGHSNYLLYNNFNTSLRNSQSNITSLIAEIQKQIANRSYDPSISHYLKNYGYIPLWVLNNILTFGTISKFYSLMNIPERQDISKTFHMLDNELENCLFYLSSLRNFCAHGNRLYCYRTKNPLMDTQYHDSLSIIKNEKNEYIQGKRDLFAGIIALKRLLSKNDFKRMSKEIYSSICTLDKKLVVLNRSDILKSMGLPDNWKNLDRL